MLLKTLKQRYDERMENIKNKELCNCPFCGQYFIETDIKGDWTNWFRYDVEGGFFDILYFSLKWIIFFYAFYWIGANTIIRVIQNETILNDLCKKL